MSTNDDLPGPQHPSFIRQLILRILPSAMLALALGLTLVWIIFLGYVLAKLIGRASKAVAIAAAGILRLAYFFAAISERGT